MYQEQQEMPSLSNRSRQNFVKKVYTVLSIQLVATVIMVWFNYSSKSFARFQMRNNWLFWTAFIVSIVSLVALFFGKISRSFPLNMGVLGVFTLAESYLVSCVCSIYTADSVLLSAIATLSASFGLTYHAMTTQTDYTSWASSSKGLLYSLSWALISISLINILFLKSSIVVMGLALVCAAIYSIYLLIDTQLILGGKNKELTLDNYVLGSVILYVDIISLFLKILQILGKKKDD